MVKQMEDEYPLIHALCPAEINLIPCHIHFITPFDRPLCDKCKIWLCHWRKFILFRIDKYSGYEMNFQGIDTLHTLNTISDLWRTRNKLTLNMHTCEWKIQALINVTLEFRAKNTRNLNPITKLDKSFNCHTPPIIWHPSNSILIIRISEGGLSCAYGKLVTVILNFLRL